MRRSGTSYALRVAALAVGLLVSPWGAGTSAAQQPDDPPVVTDTPGVAAGDVAQPGGTAVTACPTDYVTATNSDHVTAGRATAWLFFAWAKGSNEYLGLTWTRTSLQESPAGTWSMVASCWETAEPAAVGLDAARLEELAVTAEQGKSNCLVVVRDGKLAGEWYFNGTNEHAQHVTASASKSYTSTLVGIAQDDGDLDIDESASTWIPEWRGTPAEAVTVRDLLANASGREWNLLLDGGLIASQDQTAYAVGLQQLHEPNTVWEYNNPAIQTLQRVLESATGQDVIEFARERLLEPLGMTQTTMSTDPSGNATMYQGVFSTCRDMALFGQLMLDHGRWDGEQIVSSEWVDEATGQASTELNNAYGYLWWLNRPGTIIRPLSQWVDDPGITTGPLVPGAPADMYWALGAGNQIIQVDPGTDTVVVRLGTLELQPVPPTFGMEEGSAVTEAVIGE